MQPSVSITDNSKISTNNTTTSIPHSITSTSGPMLIHSIRLKRGTDLLCAIQQLAIVKNIKAGVILSAVGCISEGRLRDASGVNIQTISEHCEIVSLIGTVSAKRCHLHLSLSKEDLSTIGGHLQEGCIINTTCELVIGELPAQTIEVEFDEETGYDELIFRPIPTQP